MSYEQTLDYLYSAHTAFHVVGAAAYKPGLDTMRDIMQRLGNPHLAYPCVHVAGTNGKGSVSSLIAAVLQAAGMRVGLYTSPHLVDFRERIRVNGEMIPKEYVTGFVAQHSALSTQHTPSFFEMTTAMAFSWFAEQHVDIAVIEVGLGGRLDATNIITPLLSVITNIGLDHTDLLGATLPEIAAEKAGIIKQDVPCVIGETDPLTAPVFLRKAEECGILGGGPETTDCRIWFADQCNYLRRLRRRTAPVCQLTGPCQDTNQQTAFVALKVLNNILNGAAHQQGIAQITGATVASGFAKVCELTGLRGRWETLRTSPLVICDTAHNVHGVSTYIPRLKELLEEYSARHNMSQQYAINTHLRVVFGMVADKDVDAVLALLPKEAVYYWTQAATPRALPAADMRQRALAHGLIGNAYEQSADALTVALHDAGQDDIVFIGGSNYLVGEVLSSVSL